LRKGNQHKRMDKGRASSGFLKKTLRVASSRPVLVLILALVAAVAFIVRLLPLEWGAYLSEFDPYWHYYMAQKIVDTGPQSVFGWVDYQTWFPYGRDVAATSPMGLPFTAAAFYFILHTFGLQVSVLDVAIYLPPFMAALTCIALYFLGKDIGGREMGILAGLMLALNAAYISRTTLGFFKHESVGIFAIVLTLLLFLRAIDSKKSTKVSLIYALTAGLALAYLNISWGAFWFMLGLMPLCAFVMIIIKRYTPRLLVAYYITVGLSLLLAIPFPDPGLRVITTVGSLPAIAGFIFLAIFEVLRRMKVSRPRLWFIVVSIVAGGVGIVVLTQTGMVAPLAGKFMATLLPGLRATDPGGPIVMSVAEHRVSTWASFFQSFGTLLILAPLGFIFAYRRRKPSDVYLILFGLLALYFAASLIRLNLIMAPAFCLLAAYGVVELARSTTRAMRGVRPHAKGKAFSSLNPKVGVAFIIILIVILVPPFYTAVETAHSPVTIASASAPIREYRCDWLDALDWINYNVPKGTAVVAWWDYGYWIAIGGNSTSVADNATLNTEQIAKVGQVLLSNETEAFRLCREYFNTDYILVFVTTMPTSGGNALWGVGDEGKWGWMAAIAQGYHPEISMESVDKDGNGLPDGDTLLGKAIIYAAGYPVEFESCKVVYVSPSHQDLQQMKPTTQVIILKGET